MRLTTGGARAPGAAVIDRVIDFSVRNKFLVLLLVGAAAVAGAWSLQRVPLDAIPDLSDTQVIIYSRWDRSPDIVEEQVTYPIVTAMLGAPKVRPSAASRTSATPSSTSSSRTAPTSTGRARGRSSTSRACSAACRRTSRPSSAPTPPASGWVFQYALVDESGQHSLADLRSYQDWTLRYYLKSVPGRRRGGVGRRLRPAVPGQRRSEQAPQTTASRSSAWSRRCAAATTRWAAG